MQSKPKRPKGFRLHSNKDLISKIDSGEIEPLERNRGWFKTKRKIRDFKEERGWDLRFPKVSLGNIIATFLVIMVGYSMFTHLNNVLETNQENIPQGSVRLSSNISNGENTSLSYTYLPDDFNKTTITLIPIFLAIVVFIFVISTLFRNNGGML